MEFTATPPYIHADASRVNMWFGSGPISLSQAIFSSSIVVPIVLSRWLYRETLTPLRVAAVGLAILSVVLMGL